MLIDPLAPYLSSQGVVVLDGGLASELERRGERLDDDLWSARLLVDNPDLVREVHADYLLAGADCIVSASYQATIEGFQRHGYTDQDATALLRRAVEIALEARDDFWSEVANRRGRLRPLVAASIGPYGAFLADGSEFVGHYELDLGDLVEFHRRRWGILSNAGADLLACETLPSSIEARALATLAKTSPSVPVWMSFSCGSRTELNDGTPIAEVVAELEPVRQIVALGVNCTPPRLIDDLLVVLRGATDKHLVVYPNSGEQWDAEGRRWIPDDRASSTLASKATEWRRRGAAGIGGCCRTGPEDIALLRRRLLG